MFLFSPNNASLIGVVLNSVTPRATSLRALLRTTSGQSVLNVSSIVTCSSHSDAKKLLDLYCGSKKQTTVYFWKYCCFIKVSYQTKKLLSWGVFQYDCDWRAIIRIIATNISCYQGQMSVCELG